MTLVAGSGLACEESIISIPFFTLSPNEWFEELRKGLFVHPLLLLHN
jgi:hypothetical protein